MTNSMVRHNIASRTDEALVARVLGSVPVTEQAFSKLLSLLDIRESKEISTACVTLGARSRLLLNPDFIKAHCRTDEALSMLVMHELFHIMLGHTRLFDRVTPAQNIAFDAIINAQLCLLFPGSGHTALFRNQYQADKLPWGLLRPPEGWGTSFECWGLPGKAGQLHRALYSDASVTYGELFELLSQVLETEYGTNKYSAGECKGEEEGGVDEDLMARLLGNHGVQDDDAEGSDAAVLREIRGIVARWPMLEKRSGRDEGGDLIRDNLAVADPRQVAVGVIRCALLPLLDLDSGGSGVLRRGENPVETVLPYRTQTDRRAEVRALLDQDPLFFRAHEDYVKRARSK